MIHESLNDKLNQWKDLSTNFIDIMILINKNKSQIIAFLQSKGYKDLQDLLNQIEIKYFCKQLVEFQNDLAELQTLDSSTEIFSIGFINLIVNEYVNVNFSQFRYISKPEKENLFNFIEGIKKVPQEYNFQHIACFRSFLTSYSSYINQFNHKSASFQIFNKLKHIHNNIVMIGANGSGKSTFSRNLKSIYSKQITVIPSQKLLFYNTPYSIKTETDYVKQIHDYQIKDKLGNTDDIKNDTQEDFTNLILALKKDEENIAKFALKAKRWDKETILDKIQRVWDLFTDKKKIEFDNFKVNIINNDGSKYSINSLSDGEKAIIYYSGHIFFAEDNAFIIIDEPENHMHTALCDKLWNALEGERPDCTFIYLTHNLDFAVSRNNKTILWNKSFTPPKTWDFEELPKDDVIPERLMTEIVGSRKNLMFCEGEDKSSVDFRLYNSLFPMYTVIPMHTRNEVIRSVIAYNANPNFHYKAIGIVDRDNYRNLTTLQEQQIYVINTNEVENILCDEDFLSKAIEHFCSSYTVDNFKTDFFKIFESHIEALAIEYVTDYINDKLQSSFISNRKALSNIKQEFVELNNIKIDEIFESRKKFLELLLKSRDYNKTLMNCNFKKRLTRELGTKIVNNFEDRALELINKTSEIKALLVAKYFSHIPEN